MTRTIVATLAGLCWALPLAGQTAAVPPTSGPSLGDKVAVESLRRSAANVLVTPDAKGRAPRLVALCRFAKRLIPDDPQANRLLADVIYLSQGRTQLAADATGIYLKSFPEDQQQGMLWLRLNLAGHHTADQRAAWLDSLARNREFPAVLRAQAAADKGSILRGQGLRKEAGAMYDMAVRLDPYNSIALSGRLGLMEQATLLDRTRVLLAALRIDPGDASVVFELVGILQSLGLHSQTILFHEHLQTLERQRNGTGRISHATAVRTCTAMLDAGQAGKAVGLSQPLLGRFPDSVDLRSLLAEAFQILGQSDEAEEQADEIAAIYEPAQMLNSVPQDLNPQLAMFYLLTRPDAEKALRHAGQAAQAFGAKDPVMQRILGAAEIASEDEVLVAAGRSRLAGLMEQDLYAAVFLAEHYYAAGDSDAGKKAILAGAKMGREGPACRRLLALAKKHGVPIAAPQGAAAVGKLIESFDKRVLGAAREPEKSIQVAIQPVRERVALGEPIHVELVLRNTGPVDVSLGDRGLFKPVLSPVVSVQGQTETRFEDLPLATWPAPKYLKPDQQIVLKIRLDVGGLGRFLAERPLEEAELLVGGYLDPRQYGDKITSGLRTMKIPAGKIVREGLLGQFDRDDADAWPKRYQHCLGMIVRDMKRGKLLERMRAARQVASLLTYARRIERRTSRPPRPLHRQVTKPVLLRMMLEVLKDRSDAVRAEMIAALADVPMDKTIWHLLPRAIEDPSALVRFRLAELFVARGSPGGQAVADRLSGDDDELVRLMAKAMRKTK